MKSLLTTLFLLFASTYNAYSTELSFTEESLVKNLGEEIFKDADQSSFYSVGSVEVKSITIEEYFQDSSEPASRFGYNKGEDDAGFGEEGEDRTIYNSDDDDENEEDEDEDEDDDDEDDDYGDDETTGPLGDVVLIVDRLIGIGKKIWSIVERGRPTVRTNFSNSISVLPNVESPNVAFYEMENWSIPRFKTYEVTYKNLLGVKVASLKYGVYAQHSGTYEGKGKYLTNVTIDARDIQLYWGFKLDATSTVISIANRGSKTNPLAGVTLKIDYTLKNNLKIMRSSEVFHVTGNGSIEKLVSE